MTWEIPLSLGGPVLHWELVRATRRFWPYLLRYGYLCWLLIQFALLLAGFAARLRTEEAQPFTTPQPPHVEETPGEKFVSFSQEYVSLFLYQQLAFLVLVTPAVVAGALGHEKERGTLEGLFGTELRPAEIVFGKLIGRLAVLGQLLLQGLPLYLLMGGFSGLSLGRLLLGLVHSGLLAFAMAGATMLSSVWTRQTRDAILACYAMVTLTFLTILTLLGNLPLPIWLNPIEVVQREFTPPYVGLRPATLLLHLLVWVLAGVVCVALAIFRLRHACLVQLEGVGRRPLRVIWMLRPRIRGNPVRWRETHVLGLAPLPWLRMVPKWMAMLGVLAFALILLLSGLSSILGQGFFPAILRGDFALLEIMFSQFERVRGFQEIAVMGIILVIIAPLVVGVRCAGSIGEEKRRKTWQDLVVTPLTADEIIQGKMWGVLNAATPYLFMYMLPMLALGVMVGMGGTMLVLGFIAGAWILMFVAASLGMAYSAGQLSR
jgi:ABC-type transport system involved in multi-copper enzyme maturation permease subunit